MLQCGGDEEELSEALPHYGVPLVVEPMYTTPSQVLLVEGLRRG